VSEETTPSPAAPPPGPGLSPGAVLAADWLRDLSRTAKTARLYQSSNPVVEEARSRAWDTLGNGELLQAAETAGFDVLLTTDRDFEHLPPEMVRVERVVLGPPGDVGP